MKNNYYIIEIEGREGVDEYVKLIPQKDTKQRLLKITNKKEDATRLSFEDCELHYPSLEENFNKNYHQTIKKIEIND